MESGRLFFDPPSSCHGNMLFLGNCDPIFRGGSSVMMNMEEASKRRPFFSSPEEFYDDEYLDEQLPEKKRRLSPDQVRLLEKSFETENKLEPERKTELAKKLGLQPRQVAIWFQNRRARWKTKQLERDYDQLKSSYDSLLSTYDSIHKENEKLKAEVVSLTCKLQGKEVATGHPPPVLVADGSTLELIGNARVEDRPSSRSGGSTVVEEDSGDSCFPALIISEEKSTEYYNNNNDNDNDNDNDNVPSVGVIEQSEKDDTSDENGQNYLFVEPPEQHDQAWWVWP